MVAENREKEDSNLRAARFLCALIPSNVQILCRYWILRSDVKTRHCANEWWICFRKRVIFWTYWQSSRLCLKMAQYLRPFFGPQTRTAPSYLNAPTTVMIQEKCDFHYFPWHNVSVWNLWISFCIVGGVRKTVHTQYEHVRIRLGLYTGIQHM